MDDQLRSRVSCRNIDRARYGILLVLIELSNSYFLTAHSRAGKFRRHKAMISVEEFGATTYTCSVKVNKAAFAATVQVDHIDY